jgi:hypothetical protein
MVNKKENEPKAEKEIKAKKSNPEVEIEIENEEILGADMDITLEASHAPVDDSNLEKEEVDEQLTSLDIL